MNVVRTNFSSIEQVADQYLKQPVQKNRVASDISFDEILKQKQLDLAFDGKTDSTVKFSKHASLRLTDRGIALSSEQSQRLEDAVSHAEEKGIQESLVLMDDLAFIVNVPNHTVVTAMGKGDQSNQVFTNIDGAVIA